MIFFLLLTFRWTLEKNQNQCTFILFQVPIPAHDYEQRINNYFLALSKRKYNLQVKITLKYTLHDKRWQKKEIYRETEYGKFSETLKNPKQLFLENMKKQN